MGAQTEVLDGGTAEKRGREIRSGGLAGGVETEVLDGATAEERGREIRSGGLARGAEAEIRSGGLAESGHGSTWQLDGETERGMQDVVPVNGTETEEQGRRLGGGTEMGDAGW